MQFQEENPPLGLSGARWGSTAYANILTGTDPPRGRSVGDGGVHRT